MNSKDIKKYVYIAELNEEAQLMIKALESFGMMREQEKIVQNNQLILSLKTEEEHEANEEWVGFIQSIKIFIKKSLKISNEETKN